MREPSSARSRSPISVDPLRGALPQISTTGAGSPKSPGALVVRLRSVLDRVDAAAVRIRLTPDLVNFAGLGFGILSGALIWFDRPEEGGVALALAGIADILDGRIARRLGLASRYGQFIDSTLDRFVEVSVFLALAHYLRGHPWGPLAAAAAVSGSLLVSYTRARGESVGVLCKAGLASRAVRLVLMVAACLLDRSISSLCDAPAGSLLVVVMIVLAFVTFSTAVYRTAWIAVRLRSPIE